MCHVIQKTRTFEEIKYIKYVYKIYETYSIKEYTHIVINFRLKFCSELYRLFKVGLATIIFTIFIFFKSSLLVYCMHDYKV